MNLFVRKLIKFGKHYVEKVKQRRLEQRRAQPASDQTTTEEEVVVTGTPDESTQALTGTFFDEVPPPPEKTKILTIPELYEIGISDPDTLTGEARAAYYGDLEKGTGLPSGPVAFMEYLLAQGADILNKPLNKPGAQGNPRVRDARNILTGIQQRIENFILADENRPLSDELKRIYEQLPEPDMFTDDKDMLTSIKKWRDYVASEVRVSQQVVARGEEFGKAKEQSVDAALKRIDKGTTLVLPLLNAAIYSYLQGTGGGMSAQEKAQRPPLSTYRRRDS